MKQPTRQVVRKAISGRSSGQPSNNAKQLYKVFSRSFKTFSKRFMWPQRRLATPRQGCRSCVNFRPSEAGWMT